jgi:hypothetical protein
MPCSLTRSSKAGSQPGNVLRVRRVVIQRSASSMVQAGGRREWRPGARCACCGGRNQHQARAARSHSVALAPRRRRMVSSRTPPATIRSARRGSARQQEALLEIEPDRRLPHAAKLSGGDLVDSSTPAEASLRYGADDAEAEDRPDVPMTRSNPASVIWPQ